jgi:tetratricopeptide (TPR) repeat protein
MNRQHVAGAWMISVLMTGAVWGQVQGTIINSEGKAFPGVLKWKASAKAYTVTANNMDLEVPLASVSELQIAKPKDLETAEKQVSAGNATLAIPILEKITKDYFMLKWDKPAIRLLAEAHINAGNTDKAIKTCEAIISADPSSSYMGEIAPMYWQALLKAGKTAKTEELVLKAIKSGDRMASAFALLMRGDLVLATGDTPDNAKKALRDGYLRVITLYKSEAEAQPEALFKAAKCFEKAGQSGRADQLRSELKKNFATSGWAQK